jgi:hypothetical protein
VTAELQQVAAFRADVPLPDAETVERAYRRATRARSRPRLARQLPLAFAAAALLAAGSYAAVKDAPWWQDAPPPVDPQAVVAVARDNMPASVDVASARTVARDGRAALVAVPLDASGYCVIPALDGKATLGAQCTYQVRYPMRGDDDILTSATQPAAPGRAAAWLVYGRVTDPRAARLDLGAFTVELARGGFFVAEVPAGRWSSLAGTANDGRVLDASGTSLRDGCVSWGPAPAGQTQARSLWSDETRGSCTPQQPPVRPSVDLAHARRLFAVTLRQDYSIWKAGETVSVLTAPDSRGVTCGLVAGSAAPAPGSPFDLIGGTCAGHSTQPLDVGLGATLVHDGGSAVYAWDVGGAIRPGLDVARLELQSDAGSTPIASGGGYFFGQLPATTPGPRVGNVPLPPGRWVLVAYDAGGREVARVDLNELERRATPH